MKKKNKLLILMLCTLILTTGCTKTLKSADKKVVTNPETGQSLTANILCKPTNEKIIEQYIQNNVDLDKLPTCDNFKITSGKYEGIWESIFVKPLAYLIILSSKLVKNSALGLIIVTLLIRLLAYPMTRKTAMQSELLKDAQGDLERLEKKYANKTDQESIMKKSQEMTMIYKKYNINPISGCLYAFIQLPLLIAFLEAINRVPKIFEGTFLTIQLGTTPMIGIFTNHNFVYLILVALIGITTYFSFSLNKTTSNTTQNQMKSMSTMMIGIITITSLFMSSALGIYWLVTNLFTVVQNLLVKRSTKK